MTVAAKCQTGCPRLSTIATALLTFNVENPKVEPGFSLMYQIKIPFRNRESLLNSNERYDYDEAYAQWLISADRMRC